MRKSNPIYLDFAASAEPNPSSIHASGVKARQLLEDARFKIAHFLGARSSEIIFTSGGTEANNMALIGLVMAHEKKGYTPHVITTNIEHSSVLEPLKALERKGNISLSLIPAGNGGIVDVQDIKKAITKDTLLISVMHANNEIGTIQPILDIAKLIRHTKKHTGQKIYFHTDAVQAVSTLFLDAQKLGVDLLTISGTKIKGARGSGVLYRKTGVPLMPIMYGGEQENGLRPGTENTKAILSLALGLSHIDIVKDTKKMLVLRDYFFKKILSDKTSALCGVRINGSTKDRLAHNINITFPKIPSDLLVIELSALGIEVSSKSACKNSDSSGSYVIAALSPELGKDIGGLRISLGPTTSKKDIDYLIKSLIHILKKLKEWYV
ncbi:MAG: cysteine desulfurase family protein [Candidatus Paceibacterota bacterium]